MTEFDIDRFVSHSKAVDLSDIDWAEARRAGISDEEHRLLQFMADTEAHTIVYLHDVLVGHTITNSDVVQFMACWVYEETHHARALNRFLTAVGRPPDKDRFRRIESRVTYREALTANLARLAARLTPHFAAAHMCWGAASELLAATTYLGMARRTGNPQLAKLLAKIARDERRHFAFYHSQAEKLLERKEGARMTRALSRLAMYRFWEPVGIGVGEPGTLEMATSLLFGDEQGRAEFASIDKTIACLPGLEKFGKMVEFREQALAEFARMAPDDFARHRLQDRGLAKVA